MAGYIGNKAVGLNVTTGDILGDVGVGGDYSSKTSGTSNLRLGVNAGDSIASGGNFNVVVGDEAGTAITTGDQITAVGYQAGAAITTSSQSSFFGYQAGLATTGPGNNFFGFAAGLANTSGINNVGMGNLALSTNIDGDDNTAIGSNALRNLEPADGSSYNTAVGSQAGIAVTTSVKNTLIGGLAGDGITSGDGLNVAVGFGALGAASNTTQENVAIGNDALSTEDGHGRNVAVGFEALKTLNAGALGLNTAVGQQAGKELTTGVQNTFVGGLAGVFATTADASTFVGHQSGQGITGAKLTGAGNTAVGAESGLNLQGGGHSNSFLGTSAGTSVTTGSENTYIGFEAGDATQTAISNTAVGYRALSAAANTGNTAVGRNSLLVTTGSSNTALGKDSGNQVTGGGNNLYLGHDAGRTGSPGGPQTTGSNAIGLGDNNITSAHIKVDWTVTSDQRDKTDFTALDIGLDFVKSLNPITYKWDERSNYGDKNADDYDLDAQTPDGTHKKDKLEVGFKAQEVETLELAAGYNKDTNSNLISSVSPDGKQMGLQYSKFIPVLVKAIQELSAKNDALAARITTLEG